MKVFPKQTRSVLLLKMKLAYFKSDQLAEEERAFDCSQRESWVFLKSASRHAISLQKADLVPKQHLQNPKPKAAHLGPHDRGRSRALPPLMQSRRATLKQWFGAQPVCRLLIQFAGSGKASDD